MRFCHVVERRLGGSPPIFSETNLAGTTLTGQPLFRLSSLRWEGSLSAPGVLSLSMRVWQLELLQLGP
jgi:hypothetical protein